MKCLICGQLSLPGANLCLDCKAARKRAFDATVTQPLLAAAGTARRSASAPGLLKPSQSVPDAARRAARMALAQTQSKIEVETPRSAGRWPVIVAGMCVVLLAAGYFGHWLGAGKSNTLAAVPAELPAAGANSSPPTTASAVGSAAGAAAPVPVLIKAATPVQEVPATKTDVAKRQSPRPRPEKAAAPLPPPEPPPPLPQAVAVVPAPPVVREVPRPDPWQPMNDALASCPRDDMFARVACQRRLLTRYCEGHWGQAPQCASVPYTDRGQ